MARDPVTVENREALIDKEFQRLRVILERHQDLKDALDWFHEQSPRLEVGDVIAQDEFTHDVIVRYRDETHLVYDTT